MEGVNVRHAFLLTSLKHVFNFICTIKQNSTIQQKPRIWQQPLKSKKEIVEYFVEIGWTIFCVRFKEKKRRLVTFLCCMGFFLHFYSCTRSGYCLLVSRQTGIGFWSHSERHQVRKRSKLLYHFKHCKDLWSADGSLDR